MITEIEEEIKRTCNSCKDNENCKEYDCPIYRIKKIMEYGEKEENINIDDFFEEQNKNQVTIFDFGE